MRIESPGGHRRWRRFAAVTAAIWLGVLPILAACTSSGPRRPETPSASIEERTGASASPTGTVSVVRTCADSVYGPLLPGWRQDSPHTGPVAFALFFSQTAPRKDFRPENGGVRAYKALAVVS